MVQAKPTCWDITSSSTTPCKASC
ncbi:MAG: hypothetical protein EZS28_047580, partial [Streblomastix strix]